VGPGRSVGQAERAAAAGVHELGASGEQPEEDLGLPAAGVVAQGEHRHPGDEREGHNLPPDLILHLLVQGQVAQAGVTGASSRRPVCG
jgi:hypothetical protein